MIRESAGSGYFIFSFDHEDVLEEHIADWPSEDAPGWISSCDSALEELQRMDESHVSAPQGPVQVGVEKKILAPGSISEVERYNALSPCGAFCCYGCEIPYRGPGTPCKERRNLRCTKFEQSLGLGWDRLT
jgi:hypothetical protein